MGFFVLWDIYNDMGKFILTEEDRKSIRSLYGLNEQTNSLSVSGDYTAKDCDELHAFESTKRGDESIKVGEMNTKVANKINEWNSKGINVKPISVNVSVNGMTVNWTVTFEQSDVNWVGFTSRGAGCNDNVDYRAGNDAINNGPKSIIKNLADKKKTLGKIEIVDTFKYNGGNNTFKQVFYRYTLVDKTSGNKPTPQPSQTNTKPQPKTQPSQPTPKEFEITKKYLNNTKSDETKSESLYPEFVKQVRDYIINNGNKNYSVESISLSSKDGKNVTAKLRIIPDEKGFNKFSILFNAVGQSPVTLNYALEKNVGFIEKIEKGTIVKDNEIDPEYEWHLVGLHV